MNILSLFDGISCARIALNNLNIHIDNYFASEIDKDAIFISKQNNPDIIHIGDVKNIDAKKLPKIDLLIGGSPCQDLSNAQKGLGLEGEKSSLFFEYVRLLKELKPTYFLLENVKNKWSYIMNNYVGVNCVEINSSSYSAQLRYRLYWTNIPFQKHINNQHLNIKDIIEKEVDNKYYFNNIGLDDYINKISHNMNTKPSKDGLIKLFDIPKDIIKDNERQRRVFSIEGKSPTILARADTTKIFINNKIRKLTPLECERLQCIPDNYTNKCSDTKRYKMIGNGFTVKVIENFLQYLKDENFVNEKFITNKQYDLFNEIY